MKLIALRPTLWVEDVNATKDYYTGVLGFSVIHHSDNPGWAILKCDAVELMLARPGKDFPYTGMYFSGSFYFETDAVDDWWARLHDKAELFYPIENFSYGMREFAIRDCNGYILQFGQELK